MYKRQAYINIHFPKNADFAKHADRRLKFEEAFFFQLGYGLKKKYNKSFTIGNPFPKVGENFNNFYENFLPFELTNAQKRVLKEIRNDSVSYTHLDVYKRQDCWFNLRFFIFIK